jgi:pyruvate dehydrogenase E1 component alpha subunit
MENIVISESKPTVVAPFSGNELRQWTPEELISFEDDIALEFNSGNIQAPVHLYSGNEKEIIDVFNRVRSEDWVLCSWRSHYQCLLKGVPSAEVKSEIMAGHSITLNFPEYRVLSSAIVTGTLPIAVGLGLGIKRGGGSERVWCFLGDMSSETGAAHECIKYVRNHELPVHFVIEDNGKSVCTDTRAVWATDTLTYEGMRDPFITYYKYDTKYPHAGAGKRVQF